MGSLRDRIPQGLTSTAKKTMLAGPAQKSTRIDLPSKENYPPTLKGPGGKIRGRYDATPHSEGHFFAFWLPIVFPPFGFLNLSRRHFLLQYL